MLIGAMVPAEAYKWLEQEFNRRQFEGEDCDGLAVAMVATLQAMRGGAMIVHMMPPAAPSKEEPLPRPQSVAEVISFTLRRSA
jgi:hypothetical protein